MIRIGATLGFFTGLGLTAKNIWDRRNNPSGMFDVAVGSLTGWWPITGGWKLERMTFTLPTGAGVAHSAAYAKLKLNKYLPKGVGG